jgi:hypothetical protein
MIGAGSDRSCGAIEDLDAELDERHELTSDTQGVAGSPDIVATILAKIAEVKVFVGRRHPARRFAEWQGTREPQRADRA